MGFQQHDFENEWQGLEPEQPPTQTNRRWGVWVGLAIGIAILCVAGIFLVNLAVDYLRGPETEFLVAPTSPVATPVATSSGNGSDLDLAPTATLELADEADEPPLGAGAVTAVRLTTPPTIDGAVNDWPSLAPVASSHQVYNANSWDRTDDLSAVWMLGWDNANLYIQVVIEDDTHVQTQTGNQIFKGDSVDMQIDTQRAGDYGTAVSPDDFQITFSPGNFANLPASAFRFQGTSAGRMLDAAGGNNITVAAQQTAVGYTLEAAIPWSDLNTTPEAGLILGLSLNASDNDVVGTAVQEVMKSHVSTRRFSDPTSWGTVTLGE